MECGCPLFPNMLSDRAEKAKTSQDDLHPQDFLREFFSPALIFVSEQRIIQGLDAGAERLLDRRAEELLHGPCALLPYALSELIEETFSTREPVTDRLVPYASPERGEGLWRVNTMPIHGASGGVTAVILALHDYSLARQWEQDVRRLDLLASIGTLSLNSAHEIKNAMVAIRTFLDLLLRRNQEMELAGIASREIQRIDALVSRMLRFAVPTTTPFSSLQITEALETTLRLLQSQIEASSIRLTRSFQAEPDWVRGDPAQLQQAFLNLFFNALESMGAGGELSVSTELIRGASVPADERAGLEALLEITIRDTGVGIAPEHLGRLFDPFFTTKPHGTGLGLPITQRIIREHDGVIRVESEPGRGTVFRITFPLQPPPAKPGPLPPQTP